MPNPIRVAHYLVSRGSAFVRILNLCNAGSRKAGVGCAPTVQKCIVFKRFELPLSEKQVPRFVGNVSSC